MACYCFANFKSLGPQVAQVSFGSDGETPCQDWLTEYTMTRLILYAVSGSITMINFILKFFVRSTSNFEAHHDATIKMASTTTKMWVVQFVASGVILTLIYAKWSVLNLPENFPIFSGDYADFTIDWYAVVGSTIVTTAFINIVMPLSNLVFMLL